MQYLMGIIIVLFANVSSAGCVKGFENGYFDECGKLRSPWSYEFRQQQEIERLQNQYLIDQSIRQEEINRLRREMRQLQQMQQEQ